MRDRSVHDEFERFRLHRAELEDPATPQAVRDQTLREGALLGVGLMLGGGFPGAAACVTVLLESRFPEIAGWPWNGKADA